ncbi:MAG: hypothetical protein CL462_02150 [Acidimicrobiaceae bacterium]|nr:hypothetical protein [Acidimicrobiaceae bacterium]
MTVKYEPATRAITPIAMAAILITLRFPNAAPLLRDQATALLALSADLLFFKLRERRTRLGSLQPIRLL